MVQNDFRSFIISRRWGDDLSDFVRNATGDLRLPDAKMWEELEAYIKRRDPDAPASTISAARYIWQLYMGHGLNKKG